MGWRGRIGSQTDRKFALFFNFYSVNELKVQIHNRTVGCHVSGLKTATECKPFTLTYDPLQLLLNV